MSVQGSDAATTRNEFTLQWFPCPAGAMPGGVALVVHGLNLRPDRMWSTVKCLTGNGIEAFNLALHGHGDNYRRRPGISPEAARLESMRCVTYRLWMQEVHTAYTMAAMRAAQCGGVPIYLVAFSLGGLLGCDLFASVSDVKFSRLVLFAPALKIQWTGTLLRLLSWRPRTLIPSTTPVGYRCNPGTSMAAYNALYTAVYHFARRAGPKIDVPTLIFMDRRDELVSYPATRRFLSRAGLAHWRLLPVEKDGSAEQRYRHLIVDAASVGRKTWETMSTAVIAHLRS